MKDDATGLLRVVSDKAGLRKEVEPDKYAKVSWDYLPISLENRRDLKPAIQDHIIL
jgi:hypothetical protein